MQRDVDIRDDLSEIRRNMARMGERQDDQLNGQHADIAHFRDDVNELRAAQMQQNR